MIAEVKRTFRHQGWPNSLMSYFNVICVIRHNMTFYVICPSYENYLYNFTCTLYLWCIGMGSSSGLFCICSKLQNQTLFWILMTIIYLLFCFNNKVVSQVNKTVLHGQKYQKNYFIIVSFINFFPSRVQHSQMRYKWVRPTLAGTKIWKPL